MIVTIKELPTSIKFSTFHSFERGNWFLRTSLKSFTQTRHYEISKFNFRRRLAEPLNSHRLAHFFATPRLPRVNWNRDRMKKKPDEKRLVAVYQHKSNIDSHSGFPRFEYKKNREHYNGGRKWWQCKFQLPFANYFILLLIYLQCTDRFGSREYGKNVKKLCID